MSKRQLLLFSLLVLEATSSYAMSLGRHRGAALIGRPLDIAVQAVLDARDDPASLCLEADVFFADSKVDSSRVRVTAEKTSPSSLESTIYIRSTALIDEPVVTLYLRAGCQQKSERRYVLLADLVSDASSSSSPIFLPSTTASGAGINPAKPASNRIGAPPSTSIPQRELPGKSRPVRGQQRTITQGESKAQATVATASTPADPVPEVNPAPAGASSKKQRTKTSKPEVSVKARLKLEPLDLTFERDPALKSSVQMLSTPAANEQQRSMAAALWKALNAQPEDILRNTEKLKTLESSVAGLQADMQQSKLALNELNGAFQKAQSERYTNFFVYFLVALLLLAVGALAYLWRQRDLLKSNYSEELPWWRKNKPLEKGWGGSRESNKSLSDESGFGQGIAVHKTPQKSAKKLVELDLDLEAAESAFPGFKRPWAPASKNSIFPLSGRDRSDFALSMTHMSRALKAEELFDVQQQADFFVSLGQYEQAIDVLREHIGSNVQTSALVYLDLFNLYHLLKRETAYESLREEFGKLFNAKMPHFALYSDASPGLEAYPTALMRIEALWPSEKVLEVIEESIFRKLDDHTDAFDLGAYRELLLLYAIAKDVVSTEYGSKINFLDNAKNSQRDEGRTSRFRSTSIQPLTASVAEDRAGDIVASVLPAVPKASSQLGLDVDLTELFGNDAKLAYGNGKSAVDADSNSSFFDQFASDVTLASVQKSTVLPLPLSTSVVENLIDFDIFGSSLASIEEPELKKLE